MQVGDRVRLTQAVPVEGEKVWVSAGAVGTVQQVTLRHQYQVVGHVQTPWTVSYLWITADAKPPFGGTKMQEATQCVVVLDLGLTVTLDDAAASLQLVEATPAVVIYTDSHYSGASQILAPGRYDMGQIQLANDTISSIRVGKGLRVLLFGDAGFSGGQTIIDTDTALLKDDNSTSSLIVEKV